MGNGVHMSRDDELTNERPGGGRGFSPAVVSAVFALIVAVFICVHASDHLSGLASQAWARVGDLRAGPQDAPRAGAQSVDQPESEEESEVEPELREVRARRAERESAARPDE